MCNLYGITTNAEAIRLISKAMGGGFGNLPPLRGVFPDFVRFSPDRPPEIRPKDLSVGLSAETGTRARRTAF